MKKLLYSLISIWFCFGSTILSQSPEWITYNTSNSGLPSNFVCCIEIDEIGNKWIGTGDYAWWSGSGLAKFDGTNWTVYDTTNSDLPLTRINCLAIDEFDNKWIGTYDGLVKFDGTNWTIYNTSNSDLSSNIINCIEIDKFDNKWIGTEEGLVKFDGINWTIYNTTNSDLPSKYVLCIKTDDFNNKWIGAGGDFVKFDDTTWTIYNIPIPYPHYMGPVNRMTIDNNGDKWISVLEGEAFSWRGLIKYDDTTFAFYEQYYDSLYHEISCIEIDNFGNKWIGGSKGLAKFDDTNWADYNTSNSGLPKNHITSLAIDGSGNKWIGTYDGGLAVYKEGGVVSVEENPISEIIANEYLLSQNYPNPFNPTTTIKYSIPSVISTEGRNLKVTIKIYDVLGSEVATLVNEEQTAGNYNVDFTADKLTSGVYFYRLQAGSYVETKKMILLR